MPLQVRIADNGSIVPENPALVVGRGSAFGGMRGGLVFRAGAMEPSPVLPICFVGRGPSAKTMLIRLVAVGAYTVAIAITEIRNWHRNGRRRSMSDAEHIYSIADTHAQTVHNSNC